MKNIMEERTFNNRQRSAARLLFIVCCLLFIIPSESAVAQKKRTAKPAVPVEEQVQAAFAAYDFEHAESLLTTEIAALKRKRKSTDKLEAMLERTRQAALKLHATERITIIDSLVCPKNLMLRNIRLSLESGRIDSYASTFHQRDNSGATIYENEFGNKRFLALPAPIPESSATTPEDSPEDSAKSSSAPESTSLRLAVSDKLGTTWSAPAFLTGLIDGEDLEDAPGYAENYPFLLSDGITLYYAATGPESLGGYDIFVTRSDGEDGSFLSPENIGYPYNSPANDYLLAIDEFNQLGWFVSDRNQPADSVCIYTFIPNETRQMYGDELSDAQLRARARITSIRDTWNPEDKEMIATARKRLTALRQGGGNASTAAAPDFIFPIDDQRTYTHMADFKSPTAREKMKQWIKLDKDVTTDATMLQRLRDNYATAKASERQQMANTIQQLEATHYPQLQQLQELGKEIRNDEISHK